MTCTQGRLDYGLILFSKDMAHFRSKVLVDFHHSVSQINCLTGAIISETYIRHILRLNIFYDYTILQSIQLKRLQFSYNIFKEFFLLYMFFHPWEDWLENIWQKNDSKAFKSKATSHVSIQNGTGTVLWASGSGSRLFHIRYVFLLMRRSRTWNIWQKNDPKAYKSKATLHVLIQKRYCKLRIGIQAFFGNARFKSGYASPDSA